MLPACVKETKMKEMESVSDLDKSDSDWVNEDIKGLKDRCVSWGVSPGP